MRQHLSIAFCLLFLGSATVTAQNAQSGELRDLMKQIVLASAEHHCPEHHARMKAQFERKEVTVDRLFQGDIALNVEQAKSILAALRERRDPKQIVVRIRRQALASPTSYWPVPQEAIPYRFEDSDGEWRAAIRAGLDVLERETCIRWKHEVPGDHYMVFTREDSGAWANLGMQPGNRTRVNLGGDYATHPRDGLWNVQHETMHALGIQHEHLRYDRDAYVTINWPAVCHLWKSSSGFEAMSQNDSTNMDEPYDFGSIMHYTQQFDGDNVTMLAKNPLYQYTMGSHEGPSFKDIELLNKRYCSTVHCPDEPKCLYGGYRDPNNCAACKCPRGLAGDDCSQLAQNTQCDLQGPQLLHANSSDVNELRIPANQRANQTCYWRITAPEGKIVRIFTSTLRQDGYYVEERCRSYLEVKHAKDWRATGIRFCQNGSPLWTVHSESNEMLLILRTDPEAHALPSWVLWYTDGHPKEKKQDAAATYDAATANDVVVD